MTKEELALAEQLLVSGVASKEIKILGGKAAISISSLTTGDQLGVEFDMKTVDGTPAYTVHTYSLKLVSKILKAFTSGGKSTVFATSQEAYDFILSRPSSVVDAIINEHTKFEKELSKLASSEELVESFTETPSEDLKPN